MTEGFEVWRIVSCAEAVLLVFVIGAGWFLTADLKRRLKAQQEAHRNELEAERRGQEAVMNLSHDIRTLLNIILGSQQLLELYLKGGGMPDREKLERHIGIIRDNADRLSGLIGNLLETGKQAAGGNQMQSAAHNIVEIAEKLVLSMRDYAEGRGLTLHFNASRERIVIPCDRGKIEAVLLNLLSNAVKFTKTGGSITVGVREDNGRAVLTVKDTGIGIPAEEQRRIFERYARLQDQGAPQAEGSGIGLHAVKSIVEQHGGKISVESQYGKGSEFTVELPA